ncbi:hypothetical protein F5Y07DRAFT_293201 [Xylaria sp. FL0933]|nr:hypothetical protein F5Y07DRAFT_293201 [Xylaria sp. FL0933]
MDDTTTLVSELLNKLAELDQKVCDYRTEMAEEFRRYSHRLLQNAPEHVSARVEELVAEELHNYSALGPGLAALDSASADLDGPSDLERRSRRGRVSPPPVLPHTSGVPPCDATSGSPPDRDRDREFHGLFTPSYLPLLEVMQTTKAQPVPTVIPPVVPQPTTSQDNESNSKQEPLPDGQVDTPPRRPDPVHRHTSETMSSTNSDDSILRTPRSALRRSSSASVKDIHSPRRVRFDVEGEEVLPTVSPPTSPRIYELLASYSPDDQVTPTPDSRRHVVLEEESSILGNSPPGPKKISSTERLKALTRNSTEDTSKWTVVGDIHDDDEEEEGLVMLASKKKPQTYVVKPDPVINLENSTSSDHIRSERSRNSTGQIYNEQISNEDEVADDVLELPPLSSFKDKKRFSPPQNAQEIVLEGGSKKISELQEIPPSKTKASSSAHVLQAQVPGPEEEDMFDFDDDESPLEPQAIRTTSKYIEEEEPEIEEQVTPLADNQAEGPPVTLYSTSPAIPIVKPTSLPPTSPVSTASKQMSTSAGSYKGKPFIIGVVRDEELLKRAAEMGDFSTFVGSVDGRSGVDPSDSYSRDPWSFNGTPRSLGERLMEEAHARRISDNARKEK